MSHRRSIDRRVPEDWSLPYRERIAKRKADEREQGERARAFAAARYAASEKEERAVAFFTAAAHVNRNRTVKRSDGASYTVDANGTYRRVPFDEKAMRLMHRRIRKLTNGMNRFAEGVQAGVAGIKAFADVANGLATRGGE